MDTKTMTMTMTLLKARGLAPRLRDHCLDLSPRQLARLSSIRIDPETVTLSIHHYDAFAAPLDDDSIAAYQISRAPDVILRSTSASPDAAIAELAELPVEWVGNLDVAMVAWADGWAVLAKTHAGSQAERTKWLLESAE